MPKPRMKKLFTGRGKTRPIPRIVDASDIRASKVVAAQQTPRTSATRDVFGPRPSMGALAGTKIAGNRAKAGTYQPPSVNENI